MGQLRAEQRSDDPRSLAADLLQHAERCALTGRLRPAEALLEQAWTIAVDYDPELAGRAAWELAWLFVRRAGYDEAATWFERVAAPLAWPSRLWPVERQALAELCRAYARPGPMLTPVSALLPHDVPPAVARVALPSLRIINLGCFQMSRAGVPLPAFTAQKALALFRYLLTRPSRAAHKEELMELFWSNARGETTNSLHVAVRLLRRHLDPAEGSYLLFQNGHYLIDSEAPIENDCWCFQRLCAEASAHLAKGDTVQAQQAYAAATARYVGDYQIDNLDFTWAVAERERLLALYLSALDHLVRIYMSGQQFDAAIECCHRLLERDSLREDAYQHLMQCYWRLGRRGDALRVYQRCAAILASDLGLEPMPEIRALHQMIAGNSPPPEAFLSPPAVLAT